MEEPETKPVHEDANEVLTPPEAPPRDPMEADLPDDLTAAATKLVEIYAASHLDKSDPKQPFSVYVVWQCHILGHRKWLISTTLPDGMYYEVTYNSARMEFYLDAYKKFDNVCIPGKRFYA
jgi:hypothetical protein